MYRVLILFLVLAFFLSGCLAFWVPNKYWKAMECYSGEYTGLDTLINIDGYYSFDSIMVVPEYLMMENGRWVRKTTQSVDSKIKFWPDGFVIRNFAIRDSLESIGNSQGVNEYRIRGGSQGVYWLRGDTIIVQTLYWTDQMISPIESKYIIRNKTSIEMVAVKDFARRMTSFEKESFQSWIHPKRVLHFNKFDVKAEFDNYLYIKHRKKFYCNEELYNEYLKSLRP